MGEDDINKQEATDNADEKYDETDERINSSLMQSLESSKVRNQESGEHMMEEYQSA